MKTKISNHIFHYIFNSLKISLDSFYEEESACLITFRVLPEVCQQIILRTININRPLSISEIKWSDLLDNPSDFKAYYNILTQMKIINSNTRAFELNKNFQQNFYKIINNGLTPVNIPYRKKRKAYTKCLQSGIDSLERFLKEMFRFEDYPILSNEAENEIRVFLINKKFIRKEGGVYKLTNSAINQLLSNKQLQIRNFILKYIGNYYSKIKEPNERLGKTKNLIKFLFKLCSFEIGAVFRQLPTEYNTNEYYSHLEHLSAFGVINSKKDSKNPSKLKYYVTPLIKCLFEDMESILVSQENSKFLFVETNFKIYAYTSNELEIKILEFLFEIEYIFKEFIVGYITRNSIRRVLKRGVNAIFILDYLSMHAHSKVEEECEINGIKYNIPENVAHQIIIWEEEKNAISAFNGNLFYLLLINLYIVQCLYDFIDVGQYEYYLQEIKKRNITVLWENKEKRTIIVPKNCEDIIKQI